MNLNYESWAAPALIILLMIIILGYVGWKYSKPKEKKLRKLNVDYGDRIVEEVEQ